MNQDVLTPELLERYIAEIFKPRKDTPRYPQPIVDWHKIVEHKIRHGFDLDGTMLLSSSEMRRAKEVGAIWYEDRYGVKLNE